MTGEFPSDGNVWSNTHAMYGLCAILLILTYSIGADMFIHLNRVFVSRSKGAILSTPGGSNPATPSHHR